MNGKPLLTVLFEEESGRYNIVIPAGSTVPETVFAFAAVVRCMLRDGIISNPQDIYDMLKKYVEDPQYDEVKETEEEANEE